MKKILKIFSYLVIFALAAVLLINAYVLIMRIVFNNEHPKVFGYCHAMVLTGSMEPAVSVGDFVIYKEQDSYQIGDIIMFNTYKSYVTHRIVDVTEEGFITKGDANNTKDISPVGKQQIEGKAVLVIPKFGSFIMFLRTPLGILCMIISVFLLSLFTSTILKDDKYYY